MDYKYENGHISGYMPDINEYLAFDTVEEYAREYQKAKEEME